MSNSGPFDIENVTACPLCGDARSEVLYAKLRDRLFGVPGKWSYKRCFSCGLIFLDPRPTPETIGRAYLVYPTHETVALPNDLPRRLRAWVRRGYLARAFGYAEGTNVPQRIAGRLMHLHPGQREYANGSIMYLPASCRGRVLDVGSGAGEVLRELSQLGWEGEGVDPDPDAAQIALRDHGLNVRTGMLEDQGYPDDHFDAVVTSHVVEHVHDPISLFEECRRVLRPGGLFVAATPNAESMGHTRFGPDWRVLEPPRHLTIFSRKTLHRLAGEAGFSTSSVRTTVRGADGVYIESNKLRETAGEIWQIPVSGGEKLRGQLFQYLEWVLTHLRPGTGEELLLVAMK